jgi:8-oxo-dGTP pyrophosphatase MutT (NUDIX family)
MIKAAGILFLTTAGEALFLKRGPGGDWPGAWCFPGGATEGDESAEETAKRETIEELGFLPDGERTILARRISTNEAPVPAETINPVPPLGDPVDYTTFLQATPERFDPKLNGEHTGFAWATPNDPPEPLHPGARIALARLTMDELGIARAIAVGDLTSPQKYENVWLFAIRITGTGLAYRAGLDEHVWRDQSLYLNAEFLARCNGLSVIWEHPDKSILNPAEFEDRIIGSVVLPYIQGDEVWSVAKIYDASAAQAMESEQLSTSPAVVFRDPSVNSTIEMEDGRKLLIEGKPSLLDHICICPLGVWDKSGPPTGVLNHSLDERADSMAETAEEKKAHEEREDAARRDAAGNIDKILSHLDAVNKRMDAWEEEKKADKRRDSASRRDAEREEWKKADAEACERDDAEEKGECDKLKADGMDEEAAMDKARKDRRDRMDARRKDAESEEEKKTKMDAAEKEKADKARADAEAKEHKERADAIKADTQRMADAFANMPKSPNDADSATFADAQAVYDPAYQAFGKRAPVPLSGEALIGYRKRLARGLQPYSPDWKAVDLSAITDPTLLNIAEVRIRADAVVASRSTDDMVEGVLIPIRRTDPETGHRITEFRGRTTIFKQLSAPSQRATKFLTEKRA